jgi:Tol biopolymer transport system component
MDVLPGGKVIVYLERSANGNFDMFTLPLSGNATPTPLLVSRAEKNGARVSPDGRAIAFVASDETRSDIYVAPLPVTSPPVLAASGVWGPPAWSADGRRLFYMGGRTQMMSIAVRTAPALDVGTPKPLLELKRPAMLFEVARDGRFLLLVRLNFANQQPITVATDATGSARQ